MRHFFFDRLPTVWLREENLGGKMNLVERLDPREHLFSCVRLGAVQFCYPCNENDLGGP